MSTGNFLARLDDAQHEVDREVKVSTQKQKQQTGEGKEYDDAEREEKCMTTIGKDRELLHKVSEYLFDLFDANLMDGFKKIESFETNALPAFLHEDGVIDEYTFSLSLAFTRLCHVSRFWIFSVS